MRLAEMCDAVLVAGRVFSRLAASAGSPIGQDIPTCGDAAVTTSRGGSRADNGSAFRRLESRMTSPKISESAMSDMLGPAACETVPLKQIIRIEKTVLRSVVMDSLGR
jgi:hypothetical protein